jgi:hypothetical protein
MSAFHPFLPRQLTTLGENSQFQWAADLPRANRSGALPISRRSRRPSCARDLRTPAAEVLRDQVANSQSAAAIRGAWNRHSTPQKLDADPLVHSFQVAEKFRRRLGDTRLCALIEVSRKISASACGFFGFRRASTNVAKPSAHSVLQIKSRPVRSSLNPGTPTNCSGATARDSPAAGPLSQIQRWSRHRAPAPDVQRQSFGAVHSSERLGHMNGETHLKSGKGRANCCAACSSNRLSAASRARHSGCTRTAAILLSARIFEVVG